MDFSLFYRIFAAFLIIIIMSNILDKAKFGDHVQTKDGKMAVFLQWSNDIGGINFYEFAIKHDNNDGYDIKVLPEIEIESMIK